MLFKLAIRHVNGLAPVSEARQTGPAYLYSQIPVDPDAGPVQVRGSHMILEKTD